MIVGVGADIIFIMQKSSKYKLKRGCVPVCYNEGKVVNTVKNVKQIAYFTGSIRKKRSIVFQK